MASVISQLLPLFALLLLIAGGSWVCYQIWLLVNKVSESASERMGKKNVVFTKDGMRVGVRQMRNEKYVDTTQSWVVKAWNLAQPDNNTADDKSKKRK